MLLGCAAPPEGASPTAARTAAAVQPVGANLIGESCRIQPNQRALATLPVTRAFSIYCGRWDEPSGRVYETAAAPGGADLTLDYARGGWWREGLDARMDCVEPRPVSILDGVPAILLNCKLHAGGWDYVAVAARIDDAVYLGEGIPAILPPIENAFAGLARGFDRALAEAEQRPRSAAVRDLEAQLAGRMYGTGDLLDFRRLLEVAQHYNSNKEFAKAEERYREALALHQRLLRENNPGQSYPLMHLALQLSNQSRFEVAGSMFERADMLLDDRNRREASRLLSYRALHLANQQRHQEALALIDRSIAERRAILAATPSPRQSPPIVFADGGRREGVLLPNSRRGAQADLAVSLYVRGVILTRMGRPVEAEAALQEAFDISADLTRPADWLRPNLFLLRAEIRQARGDLPGAIQAARESIAAQRKLVANSRDEALAWLTLAGLNERAGRRAEAFEAYQNAFRIVQELGSGLEFAQVRPFLELTLAEAGRQPDRADEMHRAMFQASQLIASPITAQSIAQTVARFAAEDPARREVVRAWEDAERQRQRLKDRFDALQQQAEAPAYLLAEARDALTAAEELERQKKQELLLAFPEYYRVMDAPIGTAETQAALRADEALVSVVLGEPRSYVFLVRPEGVAVRAVDLSLAEAARIVDRLRQPFEEEEVLPHFDVVAAHDLYSRLLKPLEPQLAGVMHLITVPSGPLLSLPFALLVTEPHPPVRSYDYSQVRWLAGRMGISLSPSVSSLVRLRTQAKPSNAANAFLGFGDFVPRRDPERILARRDLPLACLDDVRKLTQFPALEGAAEELSAVQRMFRSEGSVLRTGAGFTEAAVRSAPLQDYRVLYFAAHALLPRELGCFAEPSIITSLPAGGEGSDDGLLEASEIRKLNLDAELVVLSACNTGGEGAETGGESLSGLARAFFAAGARSLLVSHWTVDSAATVALLTGAFERATAGQDLADALRDSQRAMIGGVDLSHPYYWAAFTIVGDGRKRLSPLTQQAGAGAAPPATAPMRR